MLSCLFSFAEKLLKARAGVKGLVEPSYVYLPGVPGGKEIAEKTGVDFFSVPIELGVSLPPSDLSLSRLSPC
jgi:malate dehydrogenase